MIILIALLIVGMIIMGMPIFVGILAAAILGLYVTQVSFSAIPIEILRLASSPILLAIPLFTFAGYLLGEGNTSGRLVRFSRSLFGWIPGGLGVVALVSCAFFTAITGATGITIIALGGLLLPALMSEGYKENFSLGFIAPMIRQQSGIFLAANDGKTSFVSTKDIAAVAVNSFADGLHGKELNLTGPEALDHAQVAEIIGDRIGKAITYHPLSEETMLQGARDQGMPEGAVQYMAVLYAVVRAGYMAAVTDDVEKITGHKPTEFKDFVNNNVKCWE